MVPRVMGIDPSLTGTGLAGWNGQTWRRHTIESKGRNVDTYFDTSRRLDRIVVRVEAFLDDFAPDLVVMEYPAYSSDTGHASDRAGLFWLTAKAVEKRWPGTALAFADPRARIGYALAKFSGNKDAVLAAAIKRFPDADIRNNNEADAVLDVALGCRWLYTQPGIVIPPDWALPDTKAPTRLTEVLRRVQWPASLS